MNYAFADRTQNIPRSFIREILKVTQDPNIISFAGGLPNRLLFPQEALRASTNDVFKKYGSDIYQYANSEGFIKLRELIAANYQSKGVDVSADDILITNGAQQGLDLLGKVMLNAGDNVVLEQPGYLGAIQAFAMFEPNFLPVSLSEEGINLAELETALMQKPKLMYAVPNFQNPSGLSYSNANREAVADALKGTDTIIIEDNPYGDLRFSGEEKASFKTLLPEQTVLLGSFSKVIVPGFRIGWVVAPQAIMEKLLIAKQAADLQTCHFTQYIIYEYLQQNDLQDHVQEVAGVYGKQCQTMLDCLEAYFPDNITTTRPEGGMFLWLTLPEGMSAMTLFDIALKEKVVFVPGSPFFINGEGENTLRLNFSCSDEATIKEGMKRLGDALTKYAATL